MRLLLGTNIVVGQLDVPEEFTELGVPSDVYAEMNYGITKARVAGEVGLMRERRGQLEKAIMRFGPGLPFDDAAADAYRDVT